MGKFIDKGPKRRDDPMFSGRVQMFSVRRYMPPAMTSKLPDAPATVMPETLLSEAVMARFDGQKALKRPIAKTKPASKNKAPTIEPECWFQIHQDELTDMPGRCESST